jgi:hypothetical protein
MMALSGVRFKSGPICPAQRLFGPTGLGPESRGLFGKSRRGFKAQPPMADAVHRHCSWVL